MPKVRFHVRSKLRIQERLFKAIKKSALFSWFEEITIKQLFLTFVTIIIFCGIAYNILSFFPGQGLITRGGGPFKPGLNTLLESIYFSTVTASSLGYGDITPVGISMVLAMLEVLAGLMFIGGFASKIISVKTDAMLEEIYRMNINDEIRSMRSTLFLHRKDIDKLSRGDRETMKTIAVHIGNTFAEIKYVMKTILKNDVEEHKLYINLTLESINDTLRKLVDKSKELGVKIKKSDATNIKVEVSYVIKMVNKSPLFSARIEKIESYLKELDSVSE
ncbi:MAG: two pore domain potassium channel family protein [Candidatus Aenigmarchaeota archaeon]|nr:two pore domain potassium channel family protein [Candidatus Aenigmarchaeota archaeon]